MQQNSIRQNRQCFVVIYKALIYAEKKQSDKSSAIEVTAEENAVKSDSDVITKTTQKESKQKTSTAEVSLSNVNEIETLGTCGTCSKTYF